MPPLFVPTPLSPVLEVVSVSVPSPFARPQKVVVPGLLWTFHTHSRSVSVPARAHLQSHRAQTLQARPIVLRPGQRVQGPVGEQPGSSFGAAGTLAPVASALPAVAVALEALEALQRVLQGVAAACWGLRLSPLAVRGSGLGAVWHDQGGKQERQQKTPGERHCLSSTTPPAGRRKYISVLLTFRFKSPTPKLNVDLSGTRDCLHRTCRTIRWFRRIISSTHHHNWSVNWCRSSDLKPRVLQFCDVSVPLFSFFHHPSYEFRRHPSSASSAGPFIWTWRVWGGDKGTSRHLCFFLEMTSQPSFLHPLKRLTQYEKPRRTHPPSPPYSVVSRALRPYLSLQKSTYLRGVTELKYEALCVCIKGPAACPDVKKTTACWRRSTSPFFIHTLKFEVGQNANLKRDLMSLKVYLFTLMTSSCTCMLRDYLKKGSHEDISLRTCFDLIHECIYRSKPVQLPSIQHREVPWPGCFWVLYLRLSLQSR